MEYEPAHEPLPVKAGLDNVPGVIAGADGLGSTVEEARRTSETRFRLATLATRDAIYDWDILADTSWRNDRYHELFGPVDTTSLDWWFEQLHPEDRGGVMARLQQVLEGTEARWNAEFRFRRRGGEYAHVLDRGLIVRDAAGRAVRMIGAMTDITDRKQVENALRDSQRVIQKISDATPAMIYMYDLHEHRSVYANRRCAEFFGLTLAQATLMDDALWAEHTHPQDQPERAARTLRRADLADGQVQETELRMRRNDGEWRWLQAREVVFARSDDGRPQLILGVGIDITQRKRIEEKLQRSEQLASIGTLAAGIAHEINNPVGGILLSAQSALEEIGLSPDGDYVKRCLEEIVEDAKRCGRIIQSVLRYARQESTQRWSSDINTLVKRTLHLTRESVLKREGALVLDLAEDLPLIAVNPTELEQVLVNLIQNAMDLSGGGTRVSISTRRSADGVRVVVSDNGPGIPPEQLEHIFDPFYTTRGQTGGTGLGLSVVHGIIRAHGGRIETESIPGHGTTFTVDLPC